MMVRKETLYHSGAVFRAAKPLMTAVRPKVPKKARMAGRDRRIVRYSSFHDISIGLCVPRDFGVFQFLKAGTFGLRSGNLDLGLTLDLDFSELLALGEHIAPDTEDGLGNLAND
jgi:hypothetical protein